MIRALACVVAATALLACGGPEFDHIDVTGGRSSPLGGSVSMLRVDVPEGMVVTAHIVPVDDDGDSMGASLHSRDPSILDTAPVVTSGDFAFIGKAPGTTQIEFLANGQIVLVVDAVVSAQSTP